MNAPSRETANIFRKTCLNTFESMTTESPFNAWIRFFTQRVPSDVITRLILLAFGVLAVQSFVVGIVTERAPSHGSRAVLAAGFVFLFALLVALLLALVLGYRWAWLTFTSLCAVGLVLSVVNRGDATEFGLSAIRFLLLISRPMRVHVGIGQADDPAQT